MPALRLGPRPPLLSFARAPWYLIALLGACAKPTTNVGAVSKTDVEAEQLKQQQLVIENQWTSQTRLERVALPLLKAAVPLCHSDVTMRSGMELANADVYEKSWRKAARATGLSDTVSVVVVGAGSGAERAGVHTGDRLVSLLDTTVVPGPKAMETVTHRLVEHFHAKPRYKANDDSSSTEDGYTLPATTLPLTVRRDTTTVSMIVPMDTVCAYNVVALKSDELNAFADGSTVYATTAMMRFTDDAELSTVIAHEIGHNAMHHMSAKRRNAILGGIFGAMLDVASAAGGIYSGGIYTRTMSEMGSRTFSQGFEREADYVGMYILARAGENYKDAAQVWRHMATENPGSIKFASSHPTTAERFVRLEQTATEIEKKVADRQPLMPELQAAEKQ